MDALSKTKVDMAWCPTLIRYSGRPRIIFPQDWLEFFLVGGCLPMHSMLFRRKKCFRFDPAFSFEDREWQSRMLISGMRAVPASNTCCLYNWAGPKERYVNFPGDNIKIRARMIDWLGEKCPSRYAHANLYGCLQETFRFGMKVPGASIRLLARAFGMLPVSRLDWHDPYYQGIIQRSSRL